MRCCHKPRWPLALLTTVMLWKWSWSSKWQILAIIITINHTQLTPSSLLTCNPVLNCLSLILECWNTESTMRGCLLIQLTNSALVSFPFCRGNRKKKEIRQTYWQTDLRTDRIDGLIDGQTDQKADRLKMSVCLLFYLFARQNRQRRQSDRQTDQTEKQTDGIDRQINWQAHR